MYGREYAGKKLHFEASGGLMHGSLVMQDAETDSYWPIMKARAIAGDLKGTSLEELPVGAKMRWRDWQEKHPETLVLSVQGKEDAPEGYRSYFESPRGFKGLRAKDTRLPTKEPIFAFHYKGKSYAAPHKKMAQGLVAEVDGAKLFLYRPQDAALFESTVAYLSEDSDFAYKDGVWIHEASGCQFQPERGVFARGEGTCPERFVGFDTFWYNWSLSNLDTKILK